MQIHIARNTTPLGVYSQEEVVDALNNGQLMLTDLAWREGMPTWVPLADWPEFKSVITASPFISSASGSDGAGTTVPWEKAKSFDNSAPIGKFENKTKFILNNINFSLTINGDQKQLGNSSDLIFSFDQIISFVSKFVSLKVGDLIYTGTPSGVGPVKIGDKLEGFINGVSYLTLSIK